jgi:hypothetical protein
MDGKLYRLITDLYDLMNPALLESYSGMKINDVHARVAELWGKAIDNYVNTKVNSGTIVSGIEQGTAILNGSGRCTVLNTNVRITSKFFFAPAAQGSNMRIYKENVVNNTSFDIVSAGTDLDSGLSVDWMFL